MKGNRGDRRGNTSSGESPGSELIIWVWALLAHLPTHLGIGPWLVCISCLL